MDGCLTKTEKDLLDCLRNSRLDWGANRDYSPYYYRAFWQGLTMKYNSEHEHHLSFSDVMLYFRHIVEVYNSDHSIDTLNVVRELEPLAIPVESFIFVEDGGPSSDLKYFHMRNDDRSDQDTSALYVAIAKGIDPSHSQSFAKGVSVSQSRKIYSKLASEMSADDCGCLIIAATYGSPAFTQLADTPPEKRGGAASRLVQHTKMMMDHQH